MSPVLEDRLPLLDTLTLSYGDHKEADKAFCVMEAVSYIAGEPWSDHPQCACPVITRFMVNWNDSLPSDEDRTRLLKPLITKIVGTRSTPEVELARVMLCIDWFVREQIPAWFDLVPARRLGCRLGCRWGCRQNIAPTHGRQAPTIRRATRRTHDCREVGPALRGRRRTTTGLSVLRSFASHGDCIMSTATLTPAHPPLETPWGHADVAKRLAEGIYHIATQSHGGMWIAPEAQAVIAERLPGYVPFVHRSNPTAPIAWYEEDLDWVVPAVVLADRFAAEGSLVHIQAADKLRAMRGRVSAVTNKPYFPESLYALLDEQDAQ